MNASHTPPSSSPAQHHDLIYGLDDTPSLPQALFAALQHLLAMFVAVITPAMLVCQALQLSTEATTHIISMSLFASGVASLLQIKTWGPIGSGLLSIQGTSFNFVAPLIMGGLSLKQAGNSTTAMMAALFGTLMLASVTEMLISRILPFARRVITPLVSGIVVMIIGLSLIQIGLTSMGGGISAIQDHSFGNPNHLLLSGTVLLVIILLNRQKSALLRLSSLVLAMIAGCLMAWFMGQLAVPSSLSLTPVFSLPHPLSYGLTIDWDLLLPLMLVFMITSLETIGDITATSDVSGQPVQGPLYMRRLKGGVLANGINSFISALLNTFPNSCFGQNNGVIQLTGVASRYVGFWVAILLMLLGLFPAVSQLVQAIPEPVLGGATLVMFGTIAASGVRIIARETLDRRAIMIMAISLAIGLGISQQPQILQFAPQWLKTLCSSGIATGGITAIILNVIFPIETKNKM